MSDNAAILVHALKRGEAGPSVVIKDSIDVLGVPTRCGSRALDQALPATKDADVVAQLLASGYRLVGKANMHELAYGVTGINDWTGTARNGRYPDRIPGGSSSGSAAAVAAGIADIGIGTDTGGSVRVPAACCGVVGFKPTFGLVSREGVVPQQTTLDCVGPMARSVGAIVDAMKALVPELSVTQRVRPPVLGLVSVTTDCEVSEAVLAYVRAGPVSLSRIELPSFVPAFEAGVIIIAVEAASGYRRLDKALMGADVAARLTAAEAVGEDRLAEANDIRARFTAEVDAALEHVDALLLPTLPFVPPLLAQATAMGAPLRLTELVRPFNLSGHPAITLPTQTPEGLPIGVQLVGRRGEDGVLLAVAAQIEQWQAP